jgi:hypothetical protein
MKKKVHLNNLPTIGPGGNAYALMGRWEFQAKKENWTREEMDTVLIEATKKDYEHLVNTLRKNSILEGEE